MRVYSVGEGDNVLIIAHDIFGFDGGRTKVVCDHFSQNNLKIYMPDFFRT
jgi:dienelactone hydrolase